MRKWEAVVDTLSSDVLLSGRRASSAKKIIQASKHPSNIQIRVNWVTVMVVGTSTGNFLFQAALLRSSMILKIC